MANNLKPARIQAKSKMSIKFPDFTNPNPDAIHPPVGGFYTMQRLSVKEPAWTFSANALAAKQRAVFTVPQDAMTPDIHSEFWSLP